MTIIKMNGNKNCSSFECDLDYTAEIAYQYWISCKGATHKKYKVISEHDFSFSS